VVWLSIPPQDAIKMSLYRHLKIQHREDQLPSNMAVAYYYSGQEGTKMGRFLGEKPAHC
jgi:hypothetical protein